MRNVSGVLAASAASLIIATALGVGCGDSGKESEFGDGNDERDGGSSGSSGSSGGSFEPSDGGDGRDATAPPIGVLEAIVRDFKAYAAGDATTNPDFENIPGDDDRPDGASAPYYGPWTEATATWYPGADYAIDIVLPTLGTDRLPQYNTAASFKSTAGRTATTHGKTHFDQWYRDVPGMNVTRRIPLQLTRGDGGVYTYDSAVSGVPQSSTVADKGFWPIDDGTSYATSAEGFGNQGLEHNYHFTVELHTKFTYRGTETFRFSGDDDVFVFINNKLVINIGGIHGALTREVDLPSVATDLGLELGKEYPLDFFQAERHVVQSNLRIETTLELSPQVVR